MGPPSMGRPTMNEMSVDSHPSDESSTPIALDYSSESDGKPSRAEARLALIFGVGAVTIGLVVPFVFGLLAIGFGAIAFIQIRRRPREKAGRGLAILAIVLGGVAMWIQVIAYREINGADRNARSAECQANLRNLGVAIRDYAQNDPEGAYPDDLSRLNEPQSAGAAQLIHCPADSTKQGRYSYVPGYSLSSDSDSVVAFESPTNHEGRGGNVLYQDGHVTFLFAAQLQQVIDDNKDRAK